MMLYFNHQTRYFDLYDFWMMEWTKWTNSYRTHEILLKKIEYFVIKDITNITSGTSVITGLYKIWLILRFFELPFWNAVRDIWVSHIQWGSKVAHIFDKKVQFFRKTLGLVNFCLIFHFLTSMQGYSDVI